MPTLREVLKPTPTQEPAYAWELARLDKGATLDLQQAAELLAAHIVEHLCTADAAAIWQARRAGGASLDSSQVKYLLAFLEPHFGSPGVPLKDHDHRALGSVSEFLWFELTRTRPERGRTIERVFGPGFSPTDNGGDGLVVYQLGSGGYCFRLWEIKKHTATSGSPATKPGSTDG